MQLGPINNVTSFDAPPVPQALAAATRTKYVPEGAGVDSDVASPTFTFAMFARPGPEPALNASAAAAAAS